MADTTTTDFITLTADATASDTSPFTAAAVKNIKDACGTDIISIDDATDKVLIIKTLIDAGIAKKVANTIARMFPGIPVKWGAPEIKV